MKNKNFELGMMFLLVSVMLLWSPNLTATGSGETEIPIAMGQDGNEFEEYAELEEKTYDHPSEFKKRLIIIECLDSSDFKMKEDSCFIQACNGVLVMSGCSTVRCSNLDESFYSRCLASGGPGGR